MATYKAQVIIRKYCKECGIRIHNDNTLRLCFVHRKEHYKRNYDLYIRDWKKNNSEYKKLNYKQWLIWTKNNPARRREIALESYHRNKNKPENRARKHRATHDKSNPSPSV